MRLPRRRFLRTGPTSEQEDTRRIAGLVAEEILRTDTEGAGAIADAVHLAVASLDRCRGRSRRVADSTRRGRRTHLSRTEFKAFN